MKKSSIFFAALCISLCVAVGAQARGTITLTNGAYYIDTLEHLMVGPGTWYTRARMTQQGGGSYPINVFITQIDRTNPYISFEAVLGRDTIVGTETPTKMAQRHSTTGHHLFTGINADFFTTSSTSIAEGSDCLQYGRPSGGVFVNKEIATLQSNKRQSFVIDGQGVPYLGSFGRNMYAVANNDTMTIYNINYSRYKGKLTLFNHFNGKRTSAVTAGTEVTCQLKPGETWGVNKDIHFVVTKVAQDNGGALIPADGIVLSGQGAMATRLNNLQVNDEVVVNLDLTCGGVEGLDIAMGVGGPDATKYAQMLRNGQVVKDSVWNERHPRTGIGYSMTKDTVIFCVLDGRSTTSSGATTDNEAEIMRFFGAWDAMNLDGGGSSCLYIEPLGGQVNDGSDGSERAVGSGFFAVCNAPEDNAVAQLLPYTPTLRLPKYGYTRPQFYGYNQYGVLLDKDVQGVALSCDPSVGYFMPDGQTFIALSSGDLKGTKDNAEVTIRVEVAQDAEVSFRLDSVLIDRQSDYAVEISGLVGDKQIGVLPEALTWSADDNSIVTTENGHLNGVKNGVTMVQGEIGEFSDEIKVCVEIAEQEYAPMAYTKDTTNAFASTRNVGFDLLMDERLFGCPDSILVGVVTDAPVQSLTIGLKPNNADKPVSGKYVITVEAGVKSVARFAVADLVEMEQAIYPLRLQELNFTLKDPKKNKAYTLRVDEVSLHYRDWMDPTGLENGERRMENGEWRKVMRHGRVVLDNGARRYGIAGEERP